jgi:hypothetical protein
MFVWYFWLGMASGIRSWSTDIQSPDILYVILYVGRYFVSDATTKITFLSVVLTQKSTLTFSAWVGHRFCRWSLTNTSYLIRCIDVRDLFRAVLCRCRRGNGPISCLKTLKVCSNGLFVTGTLFSTLPIFWYTRIHDIHDVSGVDSIHVCNCLVFNPC